MGTPNTRKPLSGWIGACCFSQLQSRDGEPPGFDQRAPGAGWNSGVFATLPRSVRRRAPSTPLADATSLDSPGVMPGLASDLATTLGTITRPGDAPRIVRGAVGNGVVGIDDRVVDAVIKIADDVVHGDADRLPVDAV